MKRVLSFFLLIFSLSTVCADEITLYSHRHYKADDILYKSFTEKTGIEVNVVKAKADELIERLSAEGKKTPADILIASDVARLVRAQEKDLLQSIDSKFLYSRIPSQFRDSTGHWFGFTKRARIIAYATDRVKESELSTYEDLADPKWKGRILVRSSSNIYNQSLMSSILVNHGKSEAEKWARAVRGNMARAPQGSDRDQMRAVAAGLGDIAVVNTYYYGLLLNSPEEKDRKVANTLKLFFPNQNDRGTHINVSGAGVTKHSDNIESAIKFLEFLASDEAQQVFPNETHEYPVVKSIEWSDEQKSWGAYKGDSMNVEIVGKLNGKAVKSFNRAGWE